MSDRKWSFKLRLFGVINFLIGLIAAVIQVVILSQQPDVYSTVGAGIWAGLIFLVAGIASWIISVKGSRNNVMFIVAIISTAVAIIASLVLIALSASVIHQQSNYPLISDGKLPGLYGRNNDTLNGKSFDPESLPGSLPGPLPGWLSGVYDGVKQFGLNAVQGVTNKYQFSLCNALYDNKCNFGIIKDILSKPSIQSSSRVEATVPERIPGIRVALESVLLASGLISFIINVFATCTQVMMINDPVAMA